MADAAQSLPLPRSLLAHIPDSSLQQDLLPQYDELMARARAGRPEPGSATERELVQRLSVLLCNVLERLGSHALKTLRSDVQGQLDELIQDELRSADVTRKLALRHLQRSVEVAGKLIELGGDALRGLPEAAIEALLDGAGAAAHASYIDEQLDDDLYELLAWWLALSVALECTLSDLDDLTHWSRRAVEGSRKVEALLPRLASEARAVRLQLRAQWAWADWDEQDIEDEIEAWRKLSE